MSTPFTNIYDLNSVIQTDTRLFQKPINLIYQLYYSYLQYAISYFEYDCYKDLSDITPFSQTEYAFVGDGISNSFTLDTIPTGNLFYISIDDVEVTSDKYSYDNVNNKIVCTTIPINNSHIYIANYTIGQFNTATLNPRELNILSEGMIVPWLKQQRNTDTLLNQMVYGKDFKIFSQAEHIQQLNTSIDSQYYKYVMGLISEYSWKEPSNLKGLGGGLQQ